MISLFAMIYSNAHRPATCNIILSDSNKSVYYGMLSECRLDKYYTYAVDEIEARQDVLYIAISYDKNITARGTSYYTDDLYAVMSWHSIAAVHKSPIDRAEFGMGRKIHHIEVSDNMIHIYIDTIPKSDIELQLVDKEFFKSTECEKYCTIFGDDDI